MRFLAAAIVLAALPALAETHTYNIQGMTCGGCVSSVKGKVCQLPGVEKCDVEIGKVVLSGAKLDDEAVKKAVASAGEYTVTGVGAASAETAPHATAPKATPTAKGKAGKTDHP